MKTSVYRVVEYKKWTTLGIEVHYQIQRQYNFWGWTWWVTEMYNDGDDELRAGVNTPIKFFSKESILTYIQSRNFHPTVVDYIDINQIH